MPVIQSLFEPPKSTLFMMTSIKNLIAIDGSDRIVWNRDLGHLEVGEGETKQILLLTARPYFSVREIRLSPVRDLLALIGDNGVTIVEMPRKQGRRYKTDSDNQIFCKTFNVNERLFTCVKRIRLSHVMWHPHGSEYKQMLCILTNDNRLRFYEVFRNTTTETQVINLRIRDDYVDSQEDEDDSCLGLSMLNLGDVCICFDFGPPMLVKEKEVLWPIYLLMGTGDVLLIYTNLQNPTYAENIIGPLTILPQAEDNYGSDACHILVLDSSPPLIAIATPTGRIYHCFAFPDHQGLLAKQTLYMYESIELSKDLIENPDDPYTPHPMKLFKDPTSDIRYFCVHQHGVHTVVLPILEHVQLDGDIIQDKESFSEFLVCTRTTTPTDTNESIDDLSIPRGLGVEIRKSNMALIVLMADNVIIMHRISPATTLINRKRFPRHSVLDSSRDSHDQEILNVSQIDASRANFADQIQQILKRKTSVPMLKLSENLEQNNNLLEIVQRAVATFNNEYIKKFNLANDAIRKKLSILEKDKENQLVELNKITKDKESVYMAVIELSTKADAAIQKQKELVRRIDKVLAAISHGHPDLSEVESKLRLELTSLNDKLHLYRDQLDSVVKKHKYHSNQREPFSNNNGDLMMSTTQLNGIKDTLAKQGTDIGELKRIVKLSQKQ